MSISWPTPWEMARSRSGIGWRGGVVIVPYWISL